MVNVFADHRPVDWQLDKLVWNKFARMHGDIRTNLIKPTEANAIKQQSLSQKPPSMYRLC